MSSKSTLGKEDWGDDDNVEDETRTPFGRGKLEL